MIWNYAKETSKCSPLQWSWRLKMCDSEEIIRFFTTDDCERFYRDDDVNWIVNRKLAAISNPVIDSGRSVTLVKWNNFRLIKLINPVKMKLEWRKLNFKMWAVMRIENEFEKLSVFQGKFYASKINFTRLYYNIKKKEVKKYLENL